MTQERRRDDLVVRNSDGSSTAMTVREMVIDHDRRLDLLERWQVRTEVYERLLRWTLVVATGALVVGLVNLLLNAALGR